MTDFAFGISDDIQFVMKIGGTVPAPTPASTLPYTAIQQKTAACLHSPAAVPQIVFERNYDLLEAVDTDENMYIDTGYVFTKITKVVIDCVPLLDGFTMPDPILVGSLGASRYGDSHLWQFFPCSSGKTYYARGHARNPSAPFDFDYSQRSVITLEGAAISAQYADGSVIMHTDAQAIVDDGVISLWLFSCNNTSISSTPSPTLYSKTRFYGCKIYESDTLVRDLVPVKRRTGGAVVLYDMVTAKEYAPQGGGAFTEVKEG